MTQTLEFTINFEVPAKVIYNALTDKMYYCFSHHLSDPFL